MSLTGLGKAIDESFLKATAKSGVKKAEEAFFKGTEKEIIAKNGTKLSKEGLEIEGKTSGKATELESKVATKVSQETLKLSKEALGKGKLSAAVKIDFVHETTEIAGSKLGNILKRDPVAAIKEANAKYAVKTPELVALKYKNMAESPFAFYRATNYIFYGDIATEKALATKVKIPLLGDLHLENIGTYKTANNKIAIGLNDFDDAVVGPYTWELARCATSIKLAAKESGIGQKESNELVEKFLKDYMKDLKKFQEKPEKLAEPLIESKHFGKHVEKTLEKAGAESQKDFIKEMTRDGKFELGETVKALSSQTKKDIESAISDYAKGRPEGADFYKIKDSAFHIAGKGSLGRNRYIVLLEGKSKGKADDIILEIKEATQPAASKVLGNMPGNQAQRVVNSANYFMPSASPFLGVTKIKDTEYFVRELSSTNQKVDLAKLNKNGEMKDYLETVSEIVARAHAKSGKTQEILNDSGSKSDFAEKIGEFADDYLKRVEKDFKKFVNQ